MQSRGIVATGLVALTLVASGGVLGSSHESLAATPMAATTITRERPQAGWAVASSSPRGVMVDYRMIDVAGVMFRVIRLRARTTLLRWHVGYQDPPTRYHEIPPDAGPAINWANEGVAGVVAVFNGGFKTAANAGGSMVDGVVLSPMVPGDMTVALDAAGRWKMGRWETGFPGPHFRAVAYRQNLGPLVANSEVTAAAHSSAAYLWGSPLHNVPLEPRTALGIDVHGNLIYLATMTGVTPQVLAEALIVVGAFEGMQLDINPYWPILGASFAPLHRPGKFPVQIPGAEHSPSIFASGWERDFFVAMAEPGNWRCDWSSAGLRAWRGVAQPQPLQKVCAGGPAARSAALAP